LFSASAAGLLAKSGEPGRAKTQSRRRKPGQLTTDERRTPSHNPGPARAGNGKSEENKRGGRKLIGCAQQKTAQKPGDAEWEGDVLFKRAQLLFFGLRGTHHERFSKITGGMQQAQRGGRACRPKAKQDRLTGRPLPREEATDYDHPQTQK